MRELSAEAQIAISRHLESREKKLFVIGASTISGAVALIIGFFAFLLEDLRSRTELEANIQFQSYRNTYLDPLIEGIKTELELQDKQFRNLNSQMRATFGDISEITKEMNDLRQRTEEALEGLNESGASLVFAKEIIDLRTDLLKLHGEVMKDTDASSASTRDDDRQAGESLGLTE